MRCRSSGLATYDRSPDLRVHPVERGGVQAWENCNTDLSCNALRHSR